MRPHLMMRLPVGEGDERKRYSMADPDSLGPVYGDAYHAWFYGDPGSRSLTHAQMVALFTLAQSYLHLTTYDLGQEHCVGQLRDLWRARRERAAAGGAP